MKKYLRLPVRGAYAITEGWVYSKQEQAVHGHTEHRGVDFTQKRGSPVFAAARGWAIASYQFHYAHQPTGTIKTYKRKRVGYSLGYFVQIYHPHVRRFTIYGHLASIAPNIPFFAPRKSPNHRLLPRGHKIPPHKLPTSSHAIWVSAGDVIGTIGDSGLTWGYNDYPTRPDPNKYPSWDEPHVHFEEFTRTKQGVKTDLRDPHDIYAAFQTYPDSKRKGKRGRNHLWLQQSK